MPMNAARGLDRGPAAVVVREGGHPAGDAEQAEPADQQRGPADLGRRQRRVPVRVAEEPPADQGEQDRDGERALSHDRARERVDALAGQVVHPRPDRRREHDREPEEEQADAVSLVIGLEFARVAAEPAHGRARPPRRSAARPSRRRGRTSAPGSPPGPWSGPASARRAWSPPPSWPPSTWRSRPGRSRPGWSRSNGGCSSPSTRSNRWSWPIRCGCRTRRRGRRCPGRWCRSRSRRRGRPTGWPWSARRSRCRAPRRRAAGRAAARAAGPGR